MAKVGVLCRKLSEHLKPMQAPDNSILAIAVREVLNINECLLILTEMSDIRCTADISVVEKVMTAKAGAMLLISQAIKGQQCYSTREAKLRESAVALATLGPEIQEATEKLKATKSLQDLQRALLRLPAWQDSLPAGFPPGKH